MNKKHNLKPYSFKRAPYVKWAGGKKRSLKEYSELYYPDGLWEGKYNRYVEPFVGGGSVFLDIGERFRPAQCIIGDVCEPLMTGYRCIQTEPSKLIFYLERLRSEYEALSGMEEKRTFYYNVRGRYNQFDPDAYKRSADFIFINKTGYNGLYRVNSIGLCNVPFGYRERFMFSRPGILTMNRLLNRGGSHVLTADYHETLKRAGAGTLVYLDPPALGFSSSTGFDKYTVRGFSKEDHIELSKCVRLVASIGADFMLVLSDTPQTPEEKSFFRKLYDGYYFSETVLSRVISSRSESRKSTKGLIVTSYPTRWLLNNKEES